MVETFPSPEHADQHSLTAVVKDFYYSFWFSQGSEGLQRWLMKGVVATYDRPKISMLHQHEKELFDRFSALRLPNAHQERSPNAVRREFQRQGSAFLDEIVIADESESLRELTREGRARMIDGIITRDVLFVARDPQVPRAYKADDPYKSYFREYVILSTSTGSDAYDELFLDTKQAILDNSVDSRAYHSLDQLAKQWERLHPGETFLPDNIEIL